MKLPYVICSKTIVYLEKSLTKIQRKYLVDNSWLNVCRFSINLYDVGTY